MRNFRRKINVRETKLQGPSGIYTRLFLSLIYVNYVGSSVQNGHLQHADDRTLFFKAIFNQEFKRLSLFELKSSKNTPETTSVAEPYYSSDKL